MANLIVDWEILTTLRYDEQLIKEIMPICIDDNVRLIKNLRLALKDANAEQVAYCSCSIKESAASVGAIRLFEIAFRLEQMAIAENITKAKELLQNMTLEFEKLESFISKNDWVETAKKQFADKEVIRYAI